MKFLVILFVLYIKECYGANILCLMAAPSPSHHIWNRALSYGIAKNGHNLTILSPDFEKLPPSNVHYIHLEKTYSAKYSNNELDMFEMAAVNFWLQIPVMYKFFEVTCNGAVTSDGFKTLLNYPDTFKFDLVIYDFTFGPCVLGFLHKFNYPPMISVTAFNNPPFTDQIIGGHKFYSYISHYSLSLDTKMNFFERITNVAMYSYEALYRKYIAFPKMDEIARKYFGQDIPSMYELEQKTKLLFVNTNSALDYPQPIPPNVIEVGGLQINVPKTLPKDLSDFIDSSKKGGVLFSLGTNVRSDLLGEHIQKNILKTFAELPDYHFIWKFESDMKMVIPKNVMVKPWLPQNDILGYKKTVGFISHAGLLSTQEACYHGVPIIALPVFCDQIRNAEVIVNLKIGEKLDFKELKVEEFKNTILKVLENPMYRTQIQIKSHYLRDQPSKPLDKAVWWTEWLLRNPNPEHLRSPTLDLGLMKSNIYDIVIFLTLLPIIMLFILYKLFCSRKQKHSLKQSIDKKKK